MKKLLTILLLAGLSASAQKLPAKIKIELTDRQFLSLDSAINFANTWTDSKSKSEAFVLRFQPVYDQVRRQMVIDTLKKKP